jgi:hypothetical protein
VMAGKNIVLMKRKYLITLDGVKNMLQEIYNSFGLKATAKATDLLEYFSDCKKKKIHGSYYYVLP